MQISVQWMGIQWQSFALSVTCCYIFSYMLVSPPDYEIFSIERPFFNNLNFDLLNSSSLTYRGLKFGYTFKMHYNFIAFCTRLPRWQHCCYHVSHELCSNYLSVLVKIWPHHKNKPQVWNCLSFYDQRQRMVTK